MYVCQVLVANTARSILMNVCPVLVVTEVAVWTNGTASTVCVRMELEEPFVNKVTKSTK